MKNRNESGFNPEVIVIGAGAAGLMCAREAGKRGRKVLVIEKNDRVGKKILISGGGRCNFTNLYSNPENFLSSNEHFFKSALARFTPRDFIALVEAHGIEYFEKKAGQLFCKSSAKEITQLLLRECEGTQVRILTNCTIRKIKSSPFATTTSAGKQPFPVKGEGEEFFTPSMMEKAAALFEVESSQGAFCAESLVIATGGLSFANLGATDFGYRMAEQFGLSISPPRPGLVPLTFGKEDRKNFSHLSGVSLDARVRCGNRTFQESILFTHRGLSGPAVLQISSYWKPDESLVLDLLPDFDLKQWLLENKTRGEKKELKNLLAQKLPQRFAETWCDIYFPSQPLNQISDKNLEKIGHQLHHWSWTPAGSDGYDKAEVTCGGVDTHELLSKTMESKKVPGLFFIGEVVDVTGHLGGHNFQWAWASGFAAGQVV
jgi:predicted flavoprotein YhiN